jgi:hypothetical protein
VCYRALYERVLHLLFVSAPSMVLVSLKPPLQTAVLLWEGEML